MNENLSSSDDDVPQNIIAEAKVISLDLLPKKSKELYTAAYQKFMTWMTEKKIKTVSEEVTLVYFNEMSKTLKPTSLWSIFSMLKTTLKLNDGIDIDKYSKLKSILKNNSKGYLPKKSKIFSGQDINKFITEAPNQKHLLQKVSKSNISRLSRGFLTSNFN